MTGTAHNPVPAEARGFQGDPAGVVTRTAANLVDAAVALALVLSGYLVWCAVRFLIRPAAFTFPAPPLLALFACWGFVLFSYFTVSWATTGRTAGNLLLGLSVVNRRGQRLGWTLSVIRAAFCVALPIGLYWAVVSSTSRSVQDTVLRTSVIYDWSIWHHSPAHGSSPTRTAHTIPSRRAST
jgi:uncharacterized RDD family membrane protein YckC